MLTGDKMETAKNIGITCGLIRKNMVVETCAVKKPDRESYQEYDLIDREEDPEAKKLLASRLSYHIDADSFKNTRQQLKEIRQKF
jgi:magnesium-transporting ATPase (P-type)